MPKPAHYQDVVAIGEVREVIMKHGRLAWLVVEIDQGEPCRLPLAPGHFAGVADWRRGDLLHVRGELRTHHEPGARQGLPYLVATRCLERLRRGRPTTAAGCGASGAGTPQRGG